jgi:chromosome segregation ATPase
MAQETQYGRLPKNVFSSESIDAIKNVETITPPPEKAHKNTGKREETRQTEEKQISESPSLVAELQEKINQLQNALEAQGRRIDTILESQNKVIGEFNRIESQMKEAKTVQTQLPRSTEMPVAKTEEKPQQSGNGAGLNPDEFSVEKYFYCGR